MKIKARIMDRKKIQRAIARIAQEILERNKSPEDLALVGIRTRGVPIAERIASGIESEEGLKVPIGTLDITMYRDDLSSSQERAEVHRTDIAFSVNDKDVILVDDVLFTGRTIRAAMDSLIDFGRPRTIQLAVLIDRGHRELPIRADYAGKVLPTSRKEVVQVQLEEIDGQDEVLIVEGEA
ncbi:MAG: bifunctional pyr operon transcriptional regulator/uracil phosphoribosyltransferase PyrR [Acidobacteria bacterium]|nr:bifunctional pyr operon transcriptional regulator/uracil phosphoribosyltransferase PyrR [Acidobacteriota bacterium]